jgi:hypothetical protein
MRERCLLGERQRKIEERERERKERRKQRIRESGLFRERQRER